MKRALAASSHHSNALIKPEIQSFLSNLVAPFARGAQLTQRQDSRHRREVACAVTLRFEKASDLRARP
jgi:hypothetical protein